MDCIEQKRVRKFVNSQATYDDLKNQYDIDEKILGAGSYGKVFSAKDKKDPSHIVAVKCIDKYRLTKEDLLDLRNEVELMQQVDHPNIVKYYETYDDKRYIYLCMEMCTGGDLFANLLKNGRPYSEI